MTYLARLQETETARFATYKIRDKRSRIIPYRRNRMQRHFAANATKRNIGLKARQLGWTAEEAIGILDATLWKPNHDSLFIAHNLDAAKKIFSEKIMFAWDTLPEEVRKLWHIDTNTAQTLRVEHGDGSFSSLAVDTSGRSGTYHRVHITEFAEVCKKFPERAREIIEGTIPAVPTTGRVDIESTAQGAGGLFHDMFWEAWNRKDSPRDIEYKAHFYNWTWDDEELAETIPEDVPAEFREYQKEYHLTDIQITYYFRKWLSLNKNWNALKREYPTTPEEAFSAAIEGMIYAEELDAARLEGRITRVPWIPTLPVHTVWDLGKGPNMAVGLFQRPTEGKLHWIDCVEGRLGDAMPQVIQRLKSKPYIYGKHFPPHDAYEGEIGTGQSRVDTAAGLGWVFEGTKKWPGIPRTSIESRIDLARSLWGRLWIDLEYCAPALKVLPSYQYEFDDGHGLYKNTPMHNFASHWGDVVSYTALVEDKMMGHYQGTKIIHSPVTQNWRRNY